MDLGTISATSSPLWWAVGYVRDPSVKYTTSAGAQQELVPYYTTQYSSIDEAVCRTRLLALVYYLFIDTFLD